MPLTKYKILYKRLLSVYLILNLDIVAFLFRSFLLSLQGFYLSDGRVTLVTHKVPM